MNTPRLSAGIDRCFCPTCKGMDLKGTITCTNNRFPAVDECPISLKLANHYLPRVWPGIVLTIPALFVVPAYDQSLYFHLWLTIAWLYWVISIYKIHRTISKVHSSYPIGPMKAVLVTAFCGTHPFNYIFEIGAVVLVNFAGTSLPLLVYLGVPAVFAFAFMWYVRLFSQLSLFIEYRWWKLDACGCLGSLIALSLMTPGALQLLLHSKVIEGLFSLWLAEALTPIGLLVALSCLYILRNKIALSVVTNLAHIENAHWTLDTVLDDNR